MRYIMDLDQFMYLCEQAEHNDKITSFTKTSVTEGVIDTHDVKLSYRYDSAGGALTFAPIQKHTLTAKIASDTQIEKHVDDVIAEVLSGKHQQDIENARKAANTPASIPQHVPAPVTNKITLPSNQHKENN